MSNEIVPTSFEELSNIATAMVKSGYFQDARDVSQAIVKILAGREMGIGAFQSMQAIYIIQGRPSMSANLMAAKVKSSGRYDYRVIELTDAACEIEYTQAGKPIGRSRFTLEDARKAGTKNLDKYPKNMLFARAMSNGVRWYCPDVLGSASVYTPEELGADVAEDGTVIDVKPLQTTPVVAQEARTEAQHEELTNFDVPSIEVPELNYAAAAEVKNSQGRLYIDLDDPTLRGMSRSLVASIAKGGEPAEIAEKQYKLAAIRCILSVRATAPKNDK